MSDMLCRCVCAAGSSLCLSAHGDISGTVDGSSAGWVSSALFCFQEVLYSQYGKHPREAMFYMVSGDTSAAMVGPM